MGRQGGMEVDLWDVRTLTNFIHLQDLYDLLIGK